MGEPKFLIEWEEYNCVPGFHKSYVKKMEIMEGGFDSSIWETRPLSRNVKIYMLDELKMVKEDDGNFKLVRAGASDGGEGKKDKSKRKGAGKKAKQSGD